MGYLPFDQKLLKSMVCVVVRTSADWQYQDLLLWCLSACWDEEAGAYATALLHQRVTQSIKCGQLGVDLQPPIFLQVVFQD